MRQGKVAEATAYSEMLLVRREVTVSVDWTGAGAQRELAEAVLGDVLSQWENSLGGEVHFRRVASGGEVSVSYLGSVQYQGRAAGGVTTWRRGVRSYPGSSYRYVLEADMVLRTLLPNGKPMSKAQMTHAALHEFGHVLGLGDSPLSDGVMSVLRLDRPATRPSDFEIESLLSLREEAEAVWTQAMNASASR